MGVVVTFNYAAWIARYPEFTSVGQPLAQLYFDEATIYCRNDGGGPVSTAAIQSTLLNMLTAHIAKISQPVDGVNPSGLVGRIAHAQEGSVNVQTEYTGPQPGTRAWYDQTIYGAAYWTATAQYRNMRYSAGNVFIAAGYGGPFGPRRGW